MRNKIFFVLILLLLGTPVFAENKSIHPQLQRVYQLAERNVKWDAKGSLSAKMWVLREEIGRLSIVSDPVSDRYLITKLGGPIDLVHFLALSAQVCSKKFTLEEALYRQWQLEGGPDHEKGPSRVYLPEAHPDDLPSNAFGAPLGAELIDRQDDPEADLALISNRFFAPLLPCSDEQSKQFSHNYIVMGFAQRPSHEVLMARSEWFTALPIYLLSALDKSLKSKAPNAKAALDLAGFELYPIKAKPIGIRRRK